MVKQRYIPEGVIPACLLPFNEDYSINEAEFRRHLKCVTSVKGLNAIVVNAHSTEVSSCSFDEQKKVLEITLDEVGSTIPVINGVFADGSKQASKIAKMAESYGASALLVFPPEPFSMGVSLKPEMAISHFSHIANATNLPIIAFQYPKSSLKNYTLTTLITLAEHIPSFSAIKDWCNDPMLHQKHINVLQNLSRPINVLTTHSSWLLSSLVMQPKGLLSGSGSVITDLHMNLWQAVKEYDLEKAKKIDDQIYPLAQLFYSAPIVDMHNFMKEALVILGRQKKAVVRPPLTKLTDEQINNIKTALKKANLLNE